MRVLVLNSGSSSLKFKILEVPCLEREGGLYRVLMSGGVSGIGGAARLQSAVGLAPGEAAMINRQDAGLPAYVVAVGEEAWIARQTARCLRSTGDESKRSARERVSHG